MVSGGGHGKRGPPDVGWPPFRVKGSGGVLLSHRVTPAVPSALRVLASGFGMGPGVSLSLWPPKHCRCFSLCTRVSRVSAVGRTGGTCRVFPTVYREPHSGREHACSSHRLIRWRCVLSSRRLISTGQLRRSFVPASTSGLSTQSSTGSLSPSRGMEVSSRRRLPA